MFGVKALLSGNTAVTAGFKRIGDYAVGFVLNDVKDVANLEKTVPDEFIAPSGNDVTQSAIEYLRPLILGEPKIETENGIPRHIVL